MSSRNLSRPASSSEDHENRRDTIIDDRKRKRMLSNRESARRSRMKKEQHIKDLNDQVSYLCSKSKETMKKLAHIEQRYASVESENMILKMQGEELSKRLEHLEGMLVSFNALASNDKNSVMDILQDPLLEPWLQPLQSQPVGGVYQF